MAVEGLLAIQAGSQPILLEERLRAMVPAHELRGKGKGRFREDRSGHVLEDFKEAA